MANNVDIESLLNDLQRREKAYHELALTAGPGSALVAASVIKEFAAAVHSTANCLKIIQEQDKMIRVLTKRLEALENPKPTFLDKRASRPSH